MSKSEKKRYTVHVYKVLKPVQESFFDTYEFAKNFADKSFKEDNVYKVKIWDLTKGDIIPNRHNAAALVYQLV